MLADSSGARPQAPRPMSPKRRFLASLFGGRVDRPSAATPTSVATVELMEETGVFFPEAHLDAEKMATLAEATHTLLGFDSVAPLFSVITEAAALGAEIDWGRRDWMPINVTSPWRSPEEVAVPCDFLERPSTRTALDAISMLRRRLGDHVAIIGKAMGPWTLAYHMYGVQDFLVDVVLAPDRVHAFLDALMPITLEFARAQLRAGADAVVIADHSTGDMVRAETYRDFLLPVHQTLTRELGAPTIFHCCGHSLDRMEYYAQAGFDCYHFESANDAREAVRIVNGRISLAGNVSAPGALLKGTPEDVASQVDYAVKAGVQMIAPECAVPLVTPNANLRALTAAVAHYGK